jgi:hypothetical protein
VAPESGAGLRGIGTYVLFEAVLESVAVRIVVEPDRAADTRKAKVPSGEFVIGQSVNELDPFVSILLKARLIRNP